MTMYATVARAKEHKTLSVADTTLLTDLLEAASDMVDNYCDRAFTSASRTEVYDGTGLPWIIVQHVPITALTSVTITESDGSTETIASTNFDYEAATGKIRFAPDNTSSYDEFPAEFQNISIVYTAGYSSIPEAIQEATIQIASNIYAHGSTYTNPAYKSEGMGQHNFTRIDSTAPILTPLVEALLSKYRRMTMV